MVYAYGSKVCTNTRSTESIEPCSPLADFCYLNQINSATERFNGHRDPADLSKCQAAFIFGNLFIQLYGTYNKIKILGENT